MTDLLNYLHLLFWSLTSLALASNCDTAWYKVYIDPFYISTAKRPFFRESQIDNVMSSLHCGILCDLHGPTCSTWCYGEANPTQCRLLNLLVSPHRKDGPADSFACFTRLPKDLIFGSIPTSSLNDPVYLPNGTAQRLVEGIYNYNFYQTCMALLSNAPPWVLFDLGAKYPVKRVSITTLPVYNALEMPNGARVKVGSSTPAPDGDFSSYKTLGTLGNALRAQETYFVSARMPIRGRYVAIEAKSGDTKLILCFVQAFP